MPARQSLSLRARALQWLAQREQSRVELRRKLLRVATAAARGGEAAAGDGAGGVAEDVDSDDAGRERAERVDALLDRLEAEGLLSAERFVESRVHARSARFGGARIRLELRQHGLALSADAAQALAASELNRASAVRERRFGAAPADAAAVAVQTRFLCRRGFAPEVVHRLMRSLTR